MSKFSKRRTGRKNLPRYLRVDRIRVLPYSPYHLCGVCGEPRRKGIYLILEFCKATINDTFIEDAPIREKDDFGVGTLRFASDVCAPCTKRLIAELEKSLDTMLEKS